MVRLRLLGPEYAVLCVNAGGALVHHTVILPPYFRHPFMAPGDLQIGPVWTHADHVQRGLAGVVFTIASRRLRGRRVWSVARETNTASTGLAATMGLRHAGRGIRTRRFGSRLFGQFLITERDGA